MSWPPPPTHWRRPVPVQAMQYTGTNPDSVILWAHRRGAHARTAQYTNHGREHPPLLVTCWWHRSGIYAEGAIEAGDWLVMPLGEDGHVQGWSRQEFAAAYTDTASS